MGLSIALDFFGNVYVTGIFSGPSILFGSTTISSASVGWDIFIAKSDTALLTGNNEIENSVKNIFLSPNPATNQLTVSSTQGAIEEIEIYNLLGERVLSLPLNTLKGTSASIDVSELNPGIYFVTVTATNGNKVTRKVVKM
jgi:hypothetical protein